MSTRNVWTIAAGPSPDRASMVTVGTVTKYVGRTAATMGAMRNRPAYRAAPADPSAPVVACYSWTDARDYLLRVWDPSAR